MFVKKFNISKLGFSAMLLPTFLFLLADSILAFLFPVLIERQINSNTAVGIIIAISSLAALSCDLVFPSILKDKNWRNDSILAIFFAMFFSISVFLGIQFGLIFFVLGSLAWGTFWELISFSEGEYVLSDEKKQYKKDWAWITIITTLAMLLGTLVGAIALDMNLIPSLAIILFIQFLGLIFFLVIARSKSTENKKGMHKINIFEIINRLKNWKHKSKEVKSLIGLIFIRTNIEAVYWTFAALLGISVATRNLEWFPLTIYLVATIIGGYIYIYLKILEPVKFAKKVMILGGLFLVGIYFVGDSFIMLAILLFLSNIVISFMNPAVMSAYSQFLSEHEERKEYVAIQRLTTNIAYIVGPIFFGILADYMGYLNMFATLGALSAIAGLLIRL